MLSVNAEEDPGKIYNDSINIEEWRFDVEVNIVERTGITLGERVQMMTSTERKALHNQLIEKCKRLLDTRGEQRLIEVMKVSNILMR